ncbi:DUF302 domain-containing protein [Carboxylicivirga mesophila]|uniref:DUF302 domain-containing protein n=1 Tax=Carboxylicivirga mesophila TaxID=1166478 RepID=A0ABS5KG39_9BACT|nr:DUF302 domain-containing protein [Carboxylicivirga mesophila]MBS2213428.1 DUF302 domain-containing protein [Carboxylicivirga mesophila]
MKQMIYVIIGLIVGALVMLFVVRSLAPKMMLVESQSMYSFEETLERLQAAVDEKGWKTPHVHDLQATMAKFNYDVNKVKVMEVCKPDIAQLILSKDDERIASTLMPCRISVYEKSDGNVYVSRLNSVKMGGLFGGIIKQAMDVAGNESEQIIQTVVAQ